MSFVLAVICSVIFLVADQFSKAYIAANFTLGETKGFINGIIDLTYIHNDGGAWGIMEGNTWLLLALTFLIMIICLALLIRDGFKNKLLFWSVCLILSGGIGNMIDRIFRGGEVVDFLHFSFWKSFPVFNIADCAVCIGAAMLFIYFVIDILNEHKRTVATEKAILEAAAQKNNPNSEEQK